MTSSPTWWTDLVHSTREEIGALRVAVYGSGGAPYHHAALAALFGAPPVALSADEINAGALGDVDVVVFPGGGARAMAGMLDPLGMDGAARVRDWVASGGMYVGSCAGSFLPAIVGDAYWRQHPEAERLHMVCARLSNAGDSDWEGLTSPGVGVVRAEVADPYHWLAHGLPESFELVHYNGPMFVLVDPQGNDPRLHRAEGVARFVARTDRFTPSEAFMDPDAAGGDVFDRGVDAGASTALSAAFGDGTVVLYGSHPEFGFDAIQLGWGQGARLFANALRHQAQRVAGGAVGHRTMASPVDAEESGRSSTDRLASIAPELERVSKRFDALAERSPGAWLRSGCVPRFMGLDPSVLWSAALADASRATRDAARYVRRLAHDHETVAGPARSWVDASAPDEQDYGFMGLAQIVEAIDDALDRGEAAIATGAADCLEHAYADLGAHPYQLIVSSYLSAAGLAACAALSATVLGTHLGSSEEVPVGPAPTA